MKICASRTLVDRHFAGDIRPAEERQMRAHLVSCNRCRDYYERHLLLARLDPAAIPAETRLAVGLGLESGTWVGRSPVAFLRHPATLAAAALAACLVLWLVRPGTGPAEFQARGSESAQRIWAYRVSPGAKPAELGEVMDARDELAFAFDNPSGAQRILIFGVDEHAHVYWYHPAWTDPSTTPIAVTIGTGRHELPEAIAHELDGNELTLYAVLTDDPVTVREVEQSITRADGRFTRRAAWTQRVRVTR